MLARMRRLWWVGVGILVPLELVALMLLPYSTSRIFHGGNTLEPPDRQGNFVVGALRWPVSDFARDPALSDFRAYYQQWCAGQRGLEAAVCISDRFSEQFPYGPDPQDSFSPDYNPHATLVAHTVRGEPGHCVTRSSLAVAVLLAAGIPARVVQIVLPRGLGHTILSVWDQQRGWVLFDPLYGGTLATGTRFVSLEQAIDPEAPITWTSLGKTAAGVPDQDRHTIYDALDQASILYPEPWVYIRSGPHMAPWPYRAAFLRVGVSRWWIGPAQLVLMLGIVVTALVSVAGGVRTAYRAWAHNS